MIEPALLLLVAASAYLLGSIPFPLLVGLRRGVDIRRVGSGNVGAGNLTRTVGWKPGALAAVLDGAKGLLAFTLAPASLGSAAAATAGLAAVAGHNWSVFLKGRGGRGLATSAGVLLGLNPALVVWPAAWAMAGWKLGGGIGGFAGWGVLPVYASLAPFSGTEITVATGLAVLMMARRAQGGDEREPGFRAALQRVVFDWKPPRAEPSDPPGPDADRPATA
ncbi:MAG: glycerol-3-phosphate acyltransferase [Actinobacteria bacterium]|nr:glycerol-3-phosphate acyltransferase [Actinomycetota bacterium]